MLPGMIYLMLQYPPDVARESPSAPGGPPRPSSTRVQRDHSPAPSFFLPPAPPGFRRHAVVQDSVSLQYYGPVHHQVGSLIHTEKEAPKEDSQGSDEAVERKAGTGVFLLTSEDLQLLCLELTLRFPLHLPCATGSSLDIALKASSLAFAMDDKGRVGVTGGDAEKQDGFPDPMEGTNAPNHTITGTSTSTTSSMPKTNADMHRMVKPPLMHSPEGRGNFPATPAQPRLPIAISLYHYFRPHRSPQELTRPLEHLLALHRPARDGVHWCQPSARYCGYSSSTINPNKQQSFCTLLPQDQSEWTMTSPHCQFSTVCDGSGETLGCVEELPLNWEPVLQPPMRTLPSGYLPGSGEQNGSNRFQRPWESLMPKYTPPTSYLMGLAERLAVRPGDCFGRRSLMWGHWF